LAIVNEHESFSSSKEDYRIAVNETDKQTKIYNDAMKPKREIMSKQIGDFISKLMDYLKRQ
jgi:hypothetical protein